MDEFWLKQTAEQPLFPDLLWSRPESRQTAGKLLVIGGNAHGFAAAAEAYQVAIDAGIGTARVAIPDVLQKTVGPVIEEAVFVPSTPSGSFAKDSLNEVLIQASWSDGVLIAGDLGRNAETAILLESFVTKYNGQLTITRDAVDYLYNIAELIGKREQTTLVLSLGQLQKLGTALHFETPFLLSMGVMLLAQALHSFTTRYPLTIVTKDLDTIMIAHKGKISTTKTDSDVQDLWRVGTAARTSVFWLQNPAKTFEALTTSVHKYKS